MELKDFKVGQVWRRYDGEHVTITDIWPDANFPVRAGDDSFTAHGSYYGNGEADALDLVELVQDVEESSAQTRLDAQLATAMRAPRGATAAELALFDAIVVASVVPTGNVYPEQISALLQLRRKLEQDISQ